jgi:hypothetical protein
VTVDVGDGGTFQFDLDIRSAPYVDVKIVDQIQIVNTTDITYDASSGFIEGTGGPMTYTATLQNGSALPTWITYDNTTNIFIIDAANLNQAMVTLTAKNVIGLTRGQTFKAQIANTSPIIDNSEGTISRWENITFTHTIDMNNVFSDPDPNQSLTFVVLGVPTWLTESRVGDVVTLSANASVAEIGDYNIILKAKDGYDFTQDTLTIKILINDAPAVPTTLQTTINSLEGINASTTFVAFTDTESNTVTYSMTYNDGTPINSAWITFDPTTRILNYLPTDSQSTPQTFKLIATDNHNPEVSVDIKFMINYAPNDNPAVISRTKDFMVNQNTTVKISRYIITDDDTIVNYALTLADGTAPPSWVSMTLWNESASGNFEFNGTYTILHNMLFEFTLTATDTNGLTGTANFFINALSKYKYVIL